MASSTSPDRGVRITGLIALLAGVSAVLFLISNVLLPAPSLPEQQLSVFDSDQSLYLFFGLSGALIAVFFVPFAAGFASFVREKSPSVAYAAAFLVAAGAVAEMIASDLYVGGLFAISQVPTNLIYNVEATYLAAVLSNLPNFVSSLSAAIAAFGLLLFGWCCWDGKLFPRWLSYILLLGGVLGIVGGAVGFSFISFILTGAFLVFLAVWAFGASAVLLRTKSTTTAA